MPVDLGTAYGRILVNTSGVSAGLGRASSAFGLFGRAATTGVAAAGVAVGLTFAKMIGTAADFEQELANLRSVLRPTAAEFDRLREAALELGASTRFSATEVAGAQTELAKAGLTTAEVLGGALQGTLALAAASGMELGEASTIAANAMNLFGLEGRDVTRVADALATAANSTTADVADFGMALSQGGGAAKAAGLSFQETVTILEALAEAGVKNSDAGTSLRAALTQTLAPTARARKAMQEHGLSLTDAAGNMVGAAEASRRLRGATEGMTRSQRIAFLTTIAGVDGFRALLALIDAGPRTLTKYRRELDRQGAAAESAKTRQDTLRGSLEELTGAWETLSIRIGGAAAPIARDATEAITGLLRSAAEPGALDGLGAGLERMGASAERAADALGPVFAGAVDLGSGALQALGPIAVSGATALGALAVAAGAVLGPVAGVAGAVGGSQAVMIPLVSTLLGATVGLRAFGAASGVATRLGAAMIPTLVAVGSTLRGMTASAGAARAGLGLLGTTLVSSLGKGNLIAAGIGLLAGGMVLLGSGVLNTTPPMVSLAQAMDRVDEAAQRARGALDAMRTASENLAGSARRVSTATLTVERAQRTATEALAQYGRGSLEHREALDRLKNAEVDLAVATRDQSRAATNAGRTATTMVSRLVALADENANAKEQAENLNAVMGRFRGVVPTKDAEAFERRLDKLSRTGGNTASRIIAVQQEALRMAAAIKGTGPAAETARQALESIGKATPGELKAFVESVKRGTEAGMTQVEATKAAIEANLEDVDARPNLAGYIQAIRVEGAKAIAAAREVGAGVRAGLQSGNADKRDSPSANDLLRTSLRTSRTIMEREGGAVAGTARELGRNVRDALRASAEGLEAEALRLERELTREREKLEADLERLERRAELRRRRAAISRVADAKQRAQMTADLNRELREEREDARREAAGDARLGRLERRGERRSDALQAIGDTTAEIVGAIEEFAGRVSSALDRALSDNLEEIGEDLNRATEGIDAGLSATVKALEDGTTPLLAGIDGLSTELAGAFQGIAANLAVSLAPINAALDSERAAVAALSADIDARMERRRVRDEGRRRRDLSKSAADAVANVARLEDVLSRVSTDSERAAAEALLGPARDAAAAATEELADFEEDVLIGAYQRTIDALGESITAHEKHRDDTIAAAITAATTIAAIETKAAQDRADDARVAAQARYDELKLRLSDELVLLEENLAKGTAAGRRAANKNLTAISEIMDDPIVAAAIRGSGLALGLEFSRGLDASRKTVASSAESLAAVVARYLKLKSPAEAGPLAFDFTRSGTAIGGDLAAGMRARQALVRAAADRLAAAAAMSVPALGGAGAAGGAGAGLGGAGVVQNNVFHVERPVEDLRVWSERAGFALRVAGGGL